eukprot:PhF_6_TR35023/c0_g1_i2/m.51009
MTSMEAAFSSLPKELVTVTEFHDHTHRLKRLRSHNIVWIRKCVNMTIVVVPNQRCHQVVMSECVNTKVFVMDSAVIASRTVRMINCTKSSVILEDVDIRKVELYGNSECRVVVIGDEILMDETLVVTHEGNANIEVEVGDLKKDYSDDNPVSWDTVSVYKVPATPTRLITTLYPLQYIHSVPVECEEGAALLARIAKFTVPSLPGEVDWNVAPLREPSAILSALAAIESKPPKLSPDAIDAAYDEERVEYRQNIEEVRAAALKVAGRIRAAKHVIVFSGAGISTSANIPDFRGPKGLWTMRDKTGHTGGKGLDMASAVPTYSHYAITELARLGLVKYVITTNMDGLHCRSGLPRHLIEELHGCCYTEYCPGCSAHLVGGNEVDGPMDTHHTGNKCKWCGTKLMDTIVHFGETYRDPLEPLVAGFHARKADYTLVLGTSMAVQPAVTYPLKALNKSNGGMALINMQHTPADHLATERVYIETDIFMHELMAVLGKSDFDMQYDALPDWTKVHELQQRQLKSRMAGEHRQQTTSKATLCSAGFEQRLDDALKIALRYSKFSDFAPSYYVLFKKTWMKFDTKESGVLSYDQALLFAEEMVASGWGDWALSEIEKVKLRQQSSCPGGITLEAFAEASENKNFIPKAY